MFGVAMLASLAEGAGVGTARDCARLSLYCRPSPALTGHPDHRAACHRAQRHQPSHHRDPQPGGAPLPMHATLCVHRAPSRQTLPASLAVHARRWLMRSLQHQLVFHPGILRPKASCSVPALRCAGHHAQPPAFSTCCRARAPAMWTCIATLAAVPQSLQRARQSLLQVGLTAPLAARPDVPTCVLP